MRQDIENCTRSQARKKLAETMVTRVMALTYLAGGCSRKHYSVHRIFSTLPLDSRTFSQVTTDFFHVYTCGFRSFIPKLWRTSHAAMDTSLSSGHTAVVGGTLEGFLHSPK